MRKRVSREEARDRERKAWRLRCEGWTHAKIAEKLKVDTSTITKALRRVEKRALAELVEAVELLKVTQTAQLENILSESISAWERSREPQQRVTRRTADGVEVITVEIWQGCGEVEYLDMALKALDGIRAIWGLNAPVEAGKNERSYKAPAGDGPRIRIYTVGTEEAS